MENKVFFSKLLNKQVGHFWSDLLGNLAYNHISFDLLDDTNDIWCRDFMPIQIRDNQFVQFKLTKDYYYKKDRHKITNPTPICKALGIEQIIPKYNGMPIYLDGGNVILSPSKTRVIITEKVFADNDIPRGDLANILQEVFQVEQIIFIPVETGDDTGHADGMVRFVNERTVVANDYSKVDVSQSFRERFYGALAGSGLDALPAPYHPANIKTNGYWSATGCYINFLKVGEKVFLPTFDDPVNDAASIYRFGDIFDRANIIPVPSSEVALGGGVLNCLSWVTNTNSDF